jgi:Alginate export
LRAQEFDLPMNAETFTQSTTPKRDFKEAPMPSSEPRPSFLSKGQRGRASLYAARAAAISLAAAAVGFGAPPPESPFSIPQPPFFGQVRLRTEIDSKYLLDTSINKTLYNTQSRARLGFLATPSEKVEIKVEVQDTRFMGSEPQAGANPATASVGNRAGVDLLQGYVAIQEGPVKLALGRQKMSLGAGRFLSTLEWSPGSRAFDGAAFNWNVTPTSDLTGLFYLVRDTNTAVVKSHLYLTGLHYNHKVGDAFTGEAYAFYDQSRIRSVYGADTADNSDLVYLGARAFGKVGIFTYDEEFIYQAGEMQKGARSLTSAAWQLGSRVGIALPSDFKFNAGLDIMTGDSKTTDDENTLYRANYYFAHHLYGWMDYFGVNPKYGVMDYRADADIGLFGEPGSRKATVKLAYHFFTPQDAPSADDDPYGQEFNAEVHLSLYPKSNIVLGAAAFIPGDGAYNVPVARSPKGRDTQNGFFLYVMPVFNF